MADDDQVVQFELRESGLLGGVREAEPGVQAFDCFVALMRHVPFRFGGVLHLDGVVEAFVAATDVEHGTVDRRAVIDQCRHRRDVAAVGTAVSEFAVRSVQGDSVRFSLSTPSARFGFCHPFLECSNPHNGIGPTSTHDGAPERPSSASRRPLVSSAPVGSFTA